MTHDSHRPGTKAVHGGQAPCPMTGAVMPPISLASTYAQKSPGQHQGYEYTRSHNPTRYACERCVAVLEGSTIPEGEDPSCGGFGFSSGLAAISTLLDMLEAGDQVVSMDDLYGGTHRLFRQVKARSQQLDFQCVDMSHLETLADAITDRTRLIWVETPTNPMLKIADLEAIAALGRKHGILTACDNTFCSPMLQRPLDTGFDISMHSGTKYLSGHSDVIGGFLVTSKPELAERIRFHQNSIGAVLSPFDSYLTLRGMKTLSLRIQQHCASALELAAWLESNAHVKRVIYPALPSHPQHDLATRQMRFNGAPAGGGIVTIELNGDLEGTRRVLESLGVFTLAESLGGVESLANHPAIMTHASMSQADREALGISDTLVRLSVGIEDVADLQDDLEQALSVLG